MKQKQQQQQQPSEPRKLDGLSFRGCSVDGSMDDDKKPKVRMTISSETPVLTWVRFGDQEMMAYEILDHSESSIDRSRMLDGLVIQDTHYGDQVGLIRVPVIADKKMGGDVDFCSGERACDIAQDAANGLRKNSSVGYMVDPSSYRLEGELNGYPVVRAMRWTPYEGSFVNVPADTRVGVGRELNQKQMPSVKDGEQGERTMNPKQMAELAKRANANGVGDKLAGIIETCETFEAAERALSDAIITAQGAQIQSLKERKPEMPPAGNRSAPISDGLEAVPKAQLRDYSLANVVLALGGGQVDIGFEREVAQEVVKSRGGLSKGFAIPHSVLAGKRALTVSGTSSVTVATDIMSDEFIPLLRSKSVLGELGVKFIPGLTGNVSIPKLTAGGTVYWVSENGTITESTQTLGNVPLTPKTAGMKTGISHQMLVQSAPAAEMIVRDDIIEAMARGIQKAVFQGAGGAEPSAITDAASLVDIATAGSATYAEILSLVSALDTNNGLSGNLGWAMPPLVWAKLAATTKDSGSGQFVLNPDMDKMLGYKYVTSSDVLAKSLFFADWSAVNVGIWGNGVDIIVNRDSTTGAMIITALQLCDVAVRQQLKIAYTNEILA